MARPAPGRWAATHSQGAFEAHGAAAMAALGPGKGASIVAVRRSLAVQGVIISFGDVQRFFKRHALTAEKTVHARDLLPVSWIAQIWKIPVLELGPETERAMKRSKFTGAQIAFILKQAEEGVAVAEVCRKAGISDATFYGWRKKYAGLMPSEMKRLRQLEEENGKLKKLVADLSLDKAMLQDVLSRNVWSAPPLQGLLVVMSDRQFA